MRDDKAALWPKVIRHQCKDEGIQHLCPVELIRFSWYLETEHQNMSVENKVNISEIEVEEFIIKFEM